MSSRAIVEERLAAYPENHLLFASKLYTEAFAKEMSEAAYYKTLQRLCEKRAIAKIAKGVYCRPISTRFGEVLPSEKQIIYEFTKNATGMVVGYAMYNALNLTTQIAKNIEVYSSVIDEQQKQIGKVLLKKQSLCFDERTIKSVQMLEVLQNYDTIQDMNSKSFWGLCKEYSKNYDAEACEYVLSRIKYSKRTIAFLHSILNFHNVKNSLERFLSPFSKYQIPSMEDLHEATRI